MSPQSDPLSSPDIPRIGLGTWNNKDPEQCAASVRTALEMGYRHIDTAQAYENEEAVGRGIASASVPREEIFVATKVWNSRLGYEDVLTSTRESLRRLDLDYVDLLYVHWPAGAYDPESTLRAFNQLVRDGATRHIGISNFTCDQIREAEQRSDEPIYAHQIEMHPLLPQNEINDLCREHDIHVVAYSPLRHGTVMDVPELQEIADKHNVTAAQVALAWLVRAKRVHTIPKATGEDHIRENFEATRIELDDRDVAMIDGIDRVDRYIDPSFAPW